MSNKRNDMFSLINPNARLFKELKTQMPDWWILLINDDELYIDIRKDNSINVYYFGGSIARIEFKKDFKAKIHQKYLGDFTPRGKTKKGNDKFDYDLIDLSLFDKKTIEDIKVRIKQTYLKHIENERPAEKWIQGKLVIENTNYIDSEFQFNKNLKIGKLRIDLIELQSNELSFIELKGITDSRLRNDEKRNSNIPEIIEQMRKYQLFIKYYENDIKKYYKNLLEVKRNLKLTTISSTDFSINLKPKLLIVDTYKKMTVKREQRVFDIKKLLETNNIDYKILNNK
ncbi:hypothetical protein ACFLSU_09065 [Bacteroidota bacterium]